MIIPLEAQIACVGRELVMRRRAYPRWIAAGQFGMTEKKAAHEIACMEAVLCTLQQLEEKERLI